MHGGKKVTNLWLLHYQPGDQTLFVMILINLHNFNKISLFLELKVVEISKHLDNYSNTQADFTPLTVLYNFQCNEKGSEIHLLFLLSD